MTDEIEYVLLNKKECFVYSVPPATSADGHKAADWTNSIWKGRVQICAKGDIMIIKLLDSSTGAIFAACPIPPGVAVEKVVERTIDSSRYFVLTMSDKSGRKAHLGMGFDDRNDAFDFNATLQDFRRQNETPGEIIKPVISVAPAPDLSLREGQKISVQLKALKPPNTRVVSDPFLSSLPPPPSSRSRHVQDMLDMGDGAQTSVSVPAAPAPSAPPATTPMGSLLD